MLKRRHLVIALPTESNKRLCDSEHAHLLLHHHHHHHQQQQQQQQQYQQEKKALSVERHRTRSIDRVGGRRSTTTISSLPFVRSVSNKVLYPVHTPLQRMVDESLKNAHAGLTHPMDHVRYIQSTVIPMSSTSRMSSNDEMILWLLWCNQEIGNILHVCALWNDLDTAENILQRLQIYELHTSISEFSSKQDTWHDHCPYHNAEHHHIHHQHNQRKQRQQRHHHHHQQQQQQQQQQKPIKTVLSAVDNENRTPMDTAVLCGNSGMVHLLSSFFNHSNNDSHGSIHDDEDNYNNPSGLYMYHGELDDEYNEPEWNTNTLVHQNQLLLESHSHSLPTVPHSNIGYWNQHGQLILDDKCEQEGNEEIDAMYDEVDPNDEEWIGNDYPDEDDEWYRNEVNDFDNDEDDYNFNSNQGDDDDESYLNYEAYDDDSNSVNDEIY
jgi:hypothetical protein